ncbi:MAG: S-layer homology domain-containing protein [Eubacteriales bacterium]|nr:S-layer homology domain-containing protein [Eubacteriales bacterium]
MRNTAKRTLAVIICLTMMLTLQLAAVPTALAAAPEWTAVGGPGFFAGEAFCTSLVIAADGTLYVAYKGNGNKATVMKYSDGTGWEPVGSPGFSADYIDYTSLEIGSDGTFYVAYKDAANEDKVTVMRYIPDTTAPVLTAGGVSRSSDSAATASFTSDEEGQYYYEVVAEGAVSYSVYQSTTSGIYGSPLDSVASSVYSYDAVGLTNNVTYYFKVSALDSYGNTVNSNEASATPYRYSSDSSGKSNPTVKTGKITSVTETTATLHGKIESDGNAKIIEYDFMYGTDKNSLTNKEKAGTGNHRGNFTCGLSSLEAGATYYFKAYARVNGDILYGSVLSFDTEKAIQPEPEEKQMFFDVPNTHWDYASINQLCKKGAVGGYQDGSFRPDAPSPGPNLSRSW